MIPMHRIPIKDQIIVAAYEVRDDTPLGQIELREGNLSVALSLFDNILENCKKNKCLEPELEMPEWEKEWNDLFKVLHELSIGKCVEMKAYHIWKAKGKPLQTNYQRREDYITAREDILSKWTNISCYNKMNDTLIQKINDFYKGEREKLIEIKAHWLSLARPSESPNHHFSVSTSYIDELYKVLQGERLSSDLREFIGRYQPLISVPEFLLLICTHKDKK